MYACPSYSVFQILLLKMPRLQCGRMRATNGSSAQAANLPPDWVSTQKTINWLSLNPLSSNLSLDVGTLV